MNPPDLPHDWKSFFDFIDSEPVPQDFFDDRGAAPPQIRESLNFPPESAPAKS